LSKNLSDFLVLRLVYPLQKMFLQQQERLTQSISYIWKNSDVRKAAELHKAVKLEKELEEKRQLKNKKTLL